MVNAPLFRTAEFSTAGCDSCRDAKVLYGSFSNSSGSFKILILLDAKVLYGPFSNSSGSFKSLILLEFVE